MRGMFALFKKELAVTFSSPIFYAAMFIFLVLSGYFIYSNTAYFGLLSLQAASNPYLSESLNLTDMVMKPFFGDLAIIFLLMLPLITMRMYAEEKKSGTIELLFTYPLSDGAVLAGKYGAVVLVLLAMLSGTIPYLVILEVMGDLEWGVIVSGYLGVLLMGASFAALGVFTSSLTENQIIAAVISFGALLLFWIIGWGAAAAGPVLAPILKHISLVGHLEPFLQGLIDTRDIVFHLLFVFFWLFLTRRLLNSRFWRG